MTETEIENRHEKARKILRAANGKLINSCAGPQAVAKSRLEFWQVAKGLIILQLWKDGGADVFANWLVGETWEHLESALK